MDIDGWLRRIGLEQYGKVFRENGIDLGVLPDLTDRDLETLGVLLGHRRKILRASFAPDALDNGAVGTVADRVRMPGTLPVKDTAERRQLAVVFVDMVGSTALSAQLDPEEMREVIRVYQNTVAGEISRFEGHVAKLMGDGVLAYFGWPQAHEDEAERAVRASLSVMTAIGRLKPKDGISLQARIGIATGLVVVGDQVGEGAAQEQAVVGNAPNLAARLQDVAEPGMIVIAETTRRLLGDMFRLRDLGALTLKGIEGAVPAFAVLGERPLESRFAGHHRAALEPMVGRSAEIRLLQERWRIAVAGAGQVVLLTGDAGIGKSRTAEALVDSVSEEPHTLVRFQCSPHNAGSALHPIIQHLMFAAGFDETDSPDTRLDKLESFLARAGDTPGDAAPLLAALLGLDGQARYGASQQSPQQRRNRTIAVLIGHFVALARQKPLLWVIEDIHWIDPTTLELIEQSLAQIQSARILMLLTSRPVFQPAFANESAVTRLVLNRLEAEAIEAIVSRVTRGKRLPEVLLAEIAVRTDGVPLFVEEMTKAVIEAEALQEGADAYSLRGSFSALTIPTSLHGSLMARLDRLQPVKEVAQIASVIGREFDYRTILSLTGLPEAELVEAMLKLEAAELVFCKGTPPDASYLFKHALVCDAAYESLLKSRRKVLHGRLLKLLEQRASVLPSVKAQHAEAADQPQRAITYWEQAAAHALARPAYREAVASFENCVRLSKSLPQADPRRLYSHHLQIAQALLASQGYSAASTQQAFEAALTIADQIGDAALELPSLFGIWAGKHIAGQPAADIAQRFMAIADDKDMEGPILVGLRILGIEHFYKGDFSRCLGLVKQAYDGYDSSRHSGLTKTFSQDPRAAAGNYLAWSMWCVGRFDEALAVIDTNLQWAHSLDHLHTRSLVLCYTGCAANILLRRPDRALAASTEGLSLAEEASHALWRAWSLVHHGWAISQQNLAQGLGQMDLGIEEARRIEARRLEPFHLGLAAEAYARADDHERAARYMDQAFQSMEETRNAAFASELHRIRGQTVMLAKGHVPSAEADLRQSLAIASRQRALAFQLRAARDLAAVLTGSGNLAEAAAILSPVLCQFPAAADTLDLREARALAAGLV